MTSRYPSSADLAAFRRAIVGDHLSPLDAAWMAGPNLSGHAWPHERARGIGYSAGSPTAPVLLAGDDDGPVIYPYAVACAWADAMDASTARRRAADDRARRFDRIAFHPPERWGPTYPDELRAGCPGPTDLDWFARHTSETE